MRPLRSAPREIKNEQGRQSTVASHRHQTGTAVALVFNAVTKCSGIQTAMGLLALAVQPASAATVEQLLGFDAANQSQWTTGPAFNFNTGGQDFLGLNYDKTLTAGAIARDVSTDFGLLQ